MQENEQKSNVCFRCGKFDGYYTKGRSKFERAKQGHCIKQQKIVENTDYCECWCSSHRVRSIRKETSLKVLSKLVTEIAGIKQILHKAQEDKDVAKR